MFESPAALISNLSTTPLFNYIYQSAVKLFVKNKHA